MLGKRTKLFFLISIGALIVAIVLASWGFPKIVKRQIQKNVQIETSSKMYEKWRKLPMPLTFKIYIFNISNPEEVMVGRSLGYKKLDLMFTKYREKTVLGYGDNDTVKYTLKKSFVFDAKASGTLSEMDELTVINLTYLGVILTVNGMMPAILGQVNRALEIFFGNLTDPFMHVKVKDLLFDGIYLNCDADDSALSLVCGTLRAKRPSTIRPSEDGKGYYFSMFAHWNETDLGPFEMVRGTEDVYELGHIVSYKGKRMMKEWGDPYCGQINGSDSSIFPPIDESNVPEKQYTYDPEICRSLFVDLIGKRSIFNMSAYYYELTEAALASKSVYPENKCFCRKNWSGSHDGCLLMGLLNLMPCQGAPAILSLPHFYLASEEVREYVYYGLFPDREKHKSFIYLDPVTGVVMKGAQRIQFNIELRKMPNLPQLENVRTGIFPLLWFDEGAEITEHIQEELKHSHTLLGYVETVRWAILVVAIAATIITSIAVARSGAIPACGRQNSINFITRPTNSAAVEVNKH